MHPHLRCSLALLALSLLVACGGDDPPAEPVTVGASLIVTFTDGRVDSLTWTNATWRRFETAGSSRLVIGTDGLVGNQPPSVDIHNVWEVTTLLLGPRFTTAPSLLTRSIGITGADTVWLETRVGSGGDVLRPGTVRIQGLGGDLIKLIVDADAADGALVPYHLSATIIAGPTS